MMKKAFIISAIAVPLLLTLFIGGYFFSVLQHTYQGEDKTFEVKNGDTFGRINQRLFEQGLIPDKRMFHYYAKYKKILTKFQAGSFTITKGSNFTDVANTLVYGQPNLTTITIPEGKNMYEIAKLIEQYGICSEKDFLDAAQNPEIISSLNIDAKNLEGYLYPETYRFAPKTTAKSVVKTMIDLFNNKTKEIGFSHPFLNKHQVIILASVVEKETGAKIERPLIAGVFTNRLKKRMRLQSDPTTVYGIWARYTGNIKRSDLLEETPYNTYKIPALPFGPISNPSLEAIKAVLSPEAHEYLYFVSKNDGTHVFSKTYEDHNKAVDDFQRNARARKGKSWRNLKQ
jgi:UPF0755 protein